MALAWALAVLLIGDFLTLVVLNLLPLGVRVTPVVFAAACVAAGLLLRPLAWRRRPPVRDRGVWLCAGAALVLLAMPRVPYVLEWLPGNCVASNLDDYARIPELASMVLSPRYPLRHPANAGYLLSFYYAALYPMASLKLALPFLTIKDCIFLGNLLYHALMLGALVGIAGQLGRGRAQIRVLVFAGTLFGGLDWLMKRPWKWIGHAEWWQNQFHGNTQISSFYTAPLWAVHHMAGFFALLLAWLVFTRARLSRTRKAWSVLLLLAAAFYCSPFSVMAAPLFAIPHARAIGRRLLATPAMAAVLAMALVPLYLFLAKPAAIGFALSGFRVAFTGHFWVDKLLSLPIYLTLVPVVELGGTPLVLLLVWRRLARLERAYFGAAAAFFLLTYVVAFIGANDLCMRGMLLPTFAFFALFARHADDARIAGVPVLRRTLLTVALLGALGTVREWVTLTVAGLYRSTLSWTLRHRTDLPYGLARLKAMDSRAVARDPRIVAIPWTRVSDLGFDMYSFEKLVDGKPLDRMERGELELLREPRRGFFR
jgi:hypothetical protein